jgi:phosphatidylglycerol:prolipoprotein diacylglycerol transferase
VPLYLITHMIPLVIDLPYINPIAFQFGPIAIHWYGIMYLLSFILGYIYLRKKIQKKQLKLSLDQLNDLIFLICFCLLIGGRLGYVFFYNFAQYWDSPLTVFAVWNGGMSFHGGFLGAALGFYLFWRKAKKPKTKIPSFFYLTDAVLTIIPFTLALGRVGNFINAELYGRISDLPWAMKFWTSSEYRHPVQLYEAVAHIVAGSLFIFTQAKKWPIGVRTSLFLLYYSIVRIMVEFVREPDPQIGYLLSYFTLGQLLSLPILVFGIYVLKVSLASSTKSNKLTPSQSH